ncbi:hypothetical protein A5844_000002 [Enterococcus sp. 10A9_DIV0425]|uniref:Uncharacterized protein n=1 Tax=Candidatus Enterococcus wittei TaxID=1987383 RepID=A0A2C9XPL6_9ENTE|nr:hypothetical protein A5844_000002 [Enterococcus sp. 10A9_DIV0425]
MYEGKQDYDGVRILETLTLSSNERGMNSY